MDFFSHQQQAQSNTRKLVLYLLLAVLSLLAVTHCIFYFVFTFNHAKHGVGRLYTQVQHTAAGYINSELFWYINLAILCIILIGSFYKWMTLAGGGHVVAERLGGVLIPNDTRNFYQKRILNIVQEMAIASGTPVPPVYVIDEDAINAFTAGFTPADAVIGITRGAITNLNREQLQGVIAHEFSHIFHGDARLNLQLIAILHGILVLGLLGYYILRNARGRNAGGIAGVGLGLIVLGYGGTFFGNLIKSAVSRQREFLADASAVQFTRNPDGIGGALKVIGGSIGSQMDHARVDEITHLLFAEGKEFASSMWATHPPLDVRIRRIDPRWDGKYIQPSPNADAEAASHVTAAQPAKKAGLVAAAAVIDSLSHIGEVNDAQLGYTRHLLAQVPMPVMTKSQTPDGAAELLLALVLRETGVMDNTDTTLKTTIAEAMARHKDAVDLLNGMSERWRLPLIDLCIASLKQGDMAAAKKFEEKLDEFIRFDNRTTLFEWCLRRIVRHQLHSFFKGPMRYASTQRLLEQQYNLSVVLSLLLQFDGGQQREAVIQSIATKFKLHDLQYLSREQINPAIFEKAVDALLMLRPLEKPIAIKACVDVITNDGEINVVEMELLRALAASWDCPMPPVIMT